MDEPLTDSMESNVQYEIAEEHDEHQAHGDELSIKEESDFRLISQNLNGIPAYSSDAANKGFKEFFMYTQADVTANSELNVHWRNVNDGDRLHSRMNTWFDGLKPNVTYNTTDRPKGVFQVGGTAIFSTDKACNRVMESGADPTGLGRWCWTRYRGKDGLSLRVASVYIPHNQGGDMSVYGQHRFCFNKAGNPRVPRVAFWHDFLHEVKKWIAAGDQLALMGDWNEDVRDVERKYLRQFGLYEAITKRHGPAPTHQCGSKPIDGIFLSRTIEMIRGGYLPFGEGFKSDHRVVWADLATRSVFGHLMPPIVRAAARRLNCKDPRVVKKFIASYEAFVEKHLLVERAEYLRRTTSCPLSTQQQKAYEWIDEMRIAGIRKAEHDCRKLRMGDVPYCEATIVAWKKIESWTLLIKRKRGGKVSSRKLKRITERAGIKDSFRKPLQYCEEQLAKVKIEYREIKKQAAASRSTWLEELAEALVADGHTTKAKKLLQLQAVEAQRRTWRKIKYLRRKLRSGGVTFVIDTLPDGSLKEVMDKAGMEQVLVRVHEKKIRSSEHTPLMNEPLLSDFGHLGVDKPASDKVMAGTYEPPDGCDDFAARLLRHLAQSDIAVMADECPLGIPIKVWRRFWLTAKERTASGPSAINFSVLRADAQSDMLCLFDVLMTEIPMLSGYSPKRWRKAVDAVLVKKEGVFLANKLRTIVLFEADFNYMNKFLGKTMIQSANEYGHLAREQYGSRHQHKAIDQCTNKRLTTDLLMLLREPGVLESNDASGCYDRIQHVIAALCMRRQNVPKSAIICMFSTLQDLEHKIRTAYGDSDITYGGPLWTVPVQGVGQGNGAGPTLWAIISSPVLEVLRSEGYGTFFKTAITGKDLKFVGFSFVDDTDQVQTGEYAGESSTSIVEKMQLAVDEWEGGITATGGALAPVKSHWYLIDFVWEEGKWRFARKDEQAAEILIRDSSGRKVPIDRLEVSEAKTTLGVDQCPDGNMDAQVEKMKDMTDLWAAQMRSGHLKKSEGWLALRSTIWKSLEYPLNATTLTKEQCRFIMFPAIEAGLNGIQICRNLPRDLVHGPIEDQGIGLPHLYSLQGIAHLEDCMYHTSQGTLTGELVRANLEQMIVEVGMGAEVLNLPYEKYGHLTPGTWIRHLWEFLDDSDLNMQHDISVEFRRVGDRFLMRIFGPHFTASQLDAINRCRLYLQLMTVSDVTTACGRFLTREARIGYYEKTRPHYYRWPQQQRPTDDDWQWWEAAMSMLVSTDNELVEPLGPWTDSDTTWTWFVSPSEERLYQREEGKWIYYSKIRSLRRRSLPTFERQGESTEFPMDAVRATVAQYGDQHARLLAMATRSTLYLATVDSNPSLRQAIEGLSADQKWSMQEVEWSADGGQALVDAIANGCAIAVSDGSFKDEYGTAGWTIRGDTDDVFITGSNITPGDGQYQSAYRSELSGLYGIVVAVEVLCRVFNITDGSITVACDGESALDYAFDWDNRWLRAGTAHLDLISAIRKKVRDSPIQWKFRHVRGHQDDYAQQLDRWELLNVEMDTLAKEYWHRATTNSWKASQSIAGEPWSVWRGKAKFVAPIRQEVYSHIHSPQIHAYWLSRNRYTPGTKDQIDWDAIGAAMNKSTITHRHWVTKHISGWCSVGVVAKRWKLRPTDACPLCKEQETARHVWRCRAPSAMKVWKASLSTLQAQLGRLHTAPEVIEAILSRLTKWKTGANFPAPQYSFPYLNEAIRSQDRLGWDSFLEGTLSKQWRVTQDYYLAHVKSPRTSRAWATALIRKAQMVAWSLWQHRNRILHDEAALDEDTAIQVDADIRQEFITGSQLLPRADRGLFKPGVDRVLTRNLGRKQKWLQQVQAARANWHSQAHPTWPPERIVLLRWLRQQPRL